MAHTWFHMVGTDPYPFLRDVISLRNVAKRDVSLLDNFVIKNQIFQNIGRKPPSEKQVTGTEFGSQNMVTGTECGLQKWVPEQNLDFKYWYRNKIHNVFRYPHLKSTLCSGTTI